MLAFRQDVCFGNRVVLWGVADRVLAHEERLALFRRHRCDGFVIGRRHLVVFEAAQHVEPSRGFQRGKLELCRVVDLLCLGIELGHAKVALHRYDIRRGKTHKRDEDHDDAQGFHEREAATRSRMPGIVMSSSFDHRAP